MSKIYNLAAVLMGFLLLTVPFLMGDYKDVARLEIVIIGMVMWCLLLWNGFDAFKNHMWQWLFVLVGLLGVALYIIPLPESFLTDLPGREVYGEVQDFTGVSLSQLSLIPQDTLLYFIYALAMGGIFLMMLELPRQLHYKLFVVLGVVVAFEAALGIIQYSSGVDSFYFGMKDHGNTASGTYRNRDHYVALFEMVIPLLTLLLFMKPDGKRIARGQATDKLLGKRLLIGAVLLLAVVASVLSASRAGIFLSMLGLFIALIFSLRQYGKLKSVGIFIFSFVAIAMILANIGVVSILNRFSTDPLVDLRWQIFSVSELAIKNMWPWGSGAGTFPEVFRAYQPVDMHKFINHAHNDFYELIFDLGIVGVLAVALFSIMLIFRFVSMIGCKSVVHKSVVIMVGLGIVMFLSHGYVDFNYYIPMNVLVFVFLSAIFFSKTTGSHMW